jgi:aspartate aminotransferase-like enzyme
MHTPTDPSVKADMEEARINEPALLSTIQHRDRELVVDTSRFGNDLAVAESKVITVKTVGRVDREIPFQLNEITHVIKRSSVVDLLIVKPIE